jgi:hypothetical protein
VLESQEVSEETKDVLRTLYNQLNPVALKREIDRLIQETFDEKLDERRKSAILTYGNILK